MSAKAVSSQAPITAQSAKVSESPVFRFSLPVLNRIFDFLPSKEVSKNLVVCKGPENKWRSASEDSISRFLARQSPFFQSQHVAGTSLSLQSEFWHTASGKYDIHTKYGPQAKYLYRDLLNCAEAFRSDAIKTGYREFDAIPKSDLYSFQIRGMYSDYKVFGLVSAIPTAIYFAQYKKTEANAPSGLQNYGELVFHNKEGFSSTGLEKAEVIYQVTGAIFKSWVSSKPFMNLQKYLWDTLTSCYKFEEKKKIADDVAYQLYLVLGSPAHVLPNFGELALRDFSATPAQKWEAISKATGMSQLSIVSSVRKY